MPSFQIPLSLHACTQTSESVKNSLIFVTSESSVSELTKGFKTWMKA